MAACYIIKAVNLGFTIIELITSLAIVLLAMAIISPLMQNGSNSINVKTISYDIASTLRLARSLAISRQSDIRFVLDAKNRKYWISMNPKRHTLPNDLEIFLTTSHKEIINEEIGMVNFYPDGSSSGGIITINNDNSKRRIEINWITGRITLKE